MTKVQRPRAVTVLLALIPFVAMCFSVPLWDRINPILLGLPFNLLWLIVWIPLSSLCLWCAARIESARGTREGHSS